MKLKAIGYIAPTQDQAEAWAARKVFGKAAKLAPKGFRWIMNSQQVEARIEPVGESWQALVRFP